MFAQELFGYRVALGCLQRLVRFDSTGCPIGRCPPNPQRLANNRHDVQIKRNSANRIGPRKGLSQTRGQPWVVGLPNGLAHAQPTEVERTVGKRQLHFALRNGRLGDRSTTAEEFVNTPPLLFFTLPIRLEQQSIAPRHCFAKTHLDPRAANRHDRPQTHAAFGRTQPRHQPLVIAAFQPTGRETTGKGELHFRQILLGQRHRLLPQRRIQRLAIVARDVRDILGRLQAALDLEARHARRQQLGQQRVSGQILRTEQITYAIQIDILTVANQIVRQPAGLGTLSPIRTASPQRFTRQALPRVGHAQRTVHKYFQLQLGLPTNLANLVQCQFASQDDSPHPQRGHRRQTFRTGQRHLSRRMQFQVGTHLANQTQQSQILHQHGIHIGLGKPNDCPLDLRQLLGKNQRVQRDVTPHTPLVQIVHHLGQLIQVQIRGPHTRVEPRLQAKIDRIRTVLDRRV